MRSYGNTTRRPTNGAEYVSGGFEQGNAHNLSQSDVNGRYDWSCSISADGKSVIVGGYAGYGAYSIWQKYDETNHVWGKYTSGGTFVADTPHDISITSGPRGYYGQSCSISADGKTALVGGNRKQHIYGNTMTLPTNGEGTIPMARLVLEPVIRSSHMTCP